MSASLHGPESLTALQLIVNNHPGVMLHVCGLFARRAFNLEGILVTPLHEGATCAMWLLVNEDDRMEQVVRQVRKLRDVLEVRVSVADKDVFTRLALCMEEISSPRGT
jgi:acetolactate synthase-1/3 small subunit